MQPTFTTERLILRPRTLADTEACLDMDRRPGALQHIGVSWDDPAAHRAHIESRTRGPYPPGMGYWTVLDRVADPRFLGWVELVPEHTAGPRIEIGWRLVPEAWGRGLATEAARRLLRHAFETLDLPEVVAYIDPANHRSIRVAEKLGLLPRGELADATGVSVVYVGTIRLGGQTDAHG